MNKNELTLEIIKKLESNGFKKSDIKIIKKAIKFAELKHINQKRKSGEPYIIHPLETALNLINWNSDLNTVVAGILHDIIEDTNTSKEEIERNFNKEVANMVDIVSKVSKFSEKNRGNEIKEIKKNGDDYVMKMMLSITEDTRAIIVKLADRLHNMKTIQFLTNDKQIKIATETMNIYSNIAGRLGLYDIKTELQDLSFKVLYPTKYASIKNKLDTYVTNTQNVWNEITNQIESLIKRSGLKCTIKKRIKSIYSINKKLDEGKSLRQINDIFANRVIIDGSAEDCYKVLGLIHINYIIIPNLFKDYISSPKLNLYQSLHTTISSNNSYIEIQIRNKEMDYAANYGIASHWMYKEKTVFKNNTELLYELMGDVLEDEKREEKKSKVKKISENRVFDILILNSNEWTICNDSLSLLDIAYKYNKNDFLTLSSVIVNNEKVPLYYKVKSGDAIKFNYSTIIKVEEKWLKYASLLECRETIQKYFIDLENSKNVEFEEYLNKIKNKYGNDFVGENELKARLLKVGFESFYDFVSKYKVEKNQELLEPLFRKKSPTKQEYKFIQENIYSKNGKNVLYFKGLEGVSYKGINYPSCCSKIPNINCVGVMEEKKKISIHNTDCEVGKKAKKRYMLTWNEEILKMFPRMFNCEFSFECSKDYINRIFIFLLEQKITPESILTKKIDADTMHISFKSKFENVKDVYFLFRRIDEKYNLKNLKII